MQTRTQIVSALGDLTTQSLVLPGFRATALRSLLCAITLGLFLTPALAQGHGGGSHPAPPVNPPPPLPPRPDPSTFDQTRLVFDSTAGKDSPKTGAENTCFLPPLNGMHSPTVAVTNLQVSGKPKKEYEAACTALKDKKFDSAEAHLRKAVQQEPKYAAAWTTLGQILSARQQTEDARNACSQAATADASYVPSYLCLADIAARSQQWDEMLKFSRHALDLDPTNDAVAYGYNAAANLNLHKLPEAEKSALRAVEIDKNHNDPRLHFLLAQVYEARKNPTAEAAELREYLKFAGDPADAAMVKQYLADLERQASK